MAELTLDDLMQLTQGAKLREFHLPVDQQAHGFNESWLKDIVQKEDSSDATILSDIRAASQMRIGHIVESELPHLGLKMLAYVDDNGEPLTEFREFVFYAGAMGRERTTRMEEVADWIARDLRQVFLYSNDDGYGAAPINSELAKITDIGNFKVSHFGPHKGGAGGNHLKGEKVFEYDGGRTKLSYSINLKGATIDDFSINLSVYKGLDAQPVLDARITAEQNQGSYIPSARLVVLSETSRSLQGSRGFAIYNFGPDGKFRSIEIPGTGLTLDRSNIEAMESEYARLLGVAWVGGQLCYKLNDESGGEPGTSVNALATTGEHQIIEMINDGQLDLGTDVRFVPVGSLGAAPGMQQDLLRLQYFTSLSREFGNIGLFSGGQAQNADIDYVDALQTLAGYQNSDVSAMAMLT